MNGKAIQLKQMLILPQFNTSSMHFLSSAILPGRNRETPLNIQLAML